MPPYLRVVEESAWLKGLKIALNRSGAMPMPESSLLSELAGWIAIAVIVAGGLWLRSQIRRSTDRLGEGIDRIGESVDRMGESVDRMGESIDRMGESVDRMAQSLDRMEEKLDRSLEQIESRVDRIEERQDRMQDRLERAEDRLAGALEDRAEEKGRLPDGRRRE